MAYETQTGAGCYPLMPRQLELLRFIRGFQLAKGYSPSFEEMAEGLGLAGKSSIALVLDGLEERGAIRRLFDRRRAVEVLVEVPIPRAPDGAPLRAVPGFAESRHG